MSTKPFSLQSPETIAKEYGGNKQKIAEAMQMGLLDATAGTLAGMFIDRMRAAAQAEAAPQQTVAQQVMTPQAPQQAAPAPGGLGATPQAAAMQLPPQMGQPQPAPPTTPTQPAPQGMADGGMVPPYMMGGGISELPVPATLFDEPNNGSYAGGGIIAFSEGEGVPRDDDTVYPEITATAPKPEEPAVTPPDKYIPGLRMAPTPMDINGMSKNLGVNLERLQDVAPMRSEQASRAIAEYEASLAPEAEKKARKQDMWLALGQIGAKMATTPGGLLQSIGVGISEALPGIRTASAERKKSRMEAIKELQAGEDKGNDRTLQLATFAFDMSKQYGSYAEAMNDRSFRAWAQKNEIDAGRFNTLAQVGASYYSADAGVRSTAISSGTQKSIADAELARRGQESAERTRDLILAEGPSQREYLAAKKLTPGLTLLEFATQRSGAGRYLPTYNPQSKQAPGKGFSGFSSTLIK